MYFRLYPNKENLKLINIDFIIINILKYQVENICDKFKNEIKINVFVISQIIIHKLKKFKKIIKNN